MANPSPRILISEILEDLEPADLDRFTARLREPRQDDLKPPKFRRGQLLGKSCRQLADMLVDAFGADRVVEITVWLLREIPLEAAAKDLEEAYADAVQEAPGAPAPPSQTSGGAPGAATQTGEHFVDKYREDLTNRVTNVPQILDRLLGKKVLQEEKYDEVMKLNTTQAQMRFLYNGPLRSGGNACKDVFLSVLEDLEFWLIDELRKRQA